MESTQESLFNRICLTKDTQDYNLLNKEPSSKEKLDHEKNLFKEKTCSKEKPA